MKKPRAHVFTRRNLLRGIGAGSLLLAPFVRYRSSLAQTPVAGNFLVFFTPNGHIKTEFDAEGSGASFTLKESLAALETYKSDIAVIRGLTLKTPSEINSHEEVSRILTCWEGPDKLTAYGPSVDHVIGEAIGQRPLMVAPEPNRDGLHWRNQLSWRAAEQPEPFLKDPSQVFSRIFGEGAVAQMADPAEVASLQARNQSLLDLVRGDIAVFRGRVNTEDRAHLDLYLDSLRDVERRVSTVTPTAGGGICAPDPLQARIGTLPDTPVQDDDRSPNGLAEDLRMNGELLVDMLSAGFACGTNRIASILWQGASEGLDPAKNEGSPNHHSISHSPDFDTWRAIDRWYADRFAYTLDSLKAVGMLDKTVVVWVTEIAQGHESGDFVNLVAGGQQMGFKMGQHILYPFEGNPGDINVLKESRHKSLADLWVTVQQAMGVQSNTFGDPAWSTGPLTELRG